MKDLCKSSKSFGNDFVFGFPGGQSRIQSQWPEPSVQVRSASGKSGNDNPKTSNSFNLGDGPPWMEVFGGQNGGLWVSLLRSSSLPRVFPFESSFNEAKQRPKSLVSPRKFPSGCSPRSTPVWTPDPCSVPRTSQNFDFGNAEIMIFLLYYYSLLYIFYNLLC